MSPYWTVSFLKGSGLLALLIPVSWSLGLPERANRYSICIYSLMKAMWNVLEIHMENVSNSVCREFKGV